MIYAVGFTALEDLQLVRLCTKAAVEITTP